MDALERAKGLSGSVAVEHIISGDDSNQPKAPQTAPTNAYKATPEDIAYVAQTMFGEAGNEPEMGIYGVGHVINNRFKQGKYKTYKDVVLAKNQFEAWDKGYAQKLTPNHPRYGEFYTRAEQIINNQYPDPTNGALFFYNPALANPSWGKTFKETATIGRHRFMHSDINHPTPGYEAGNTELINALKSLKQDRDNELLKALTDFRKELGR